MKLLTFLVPENMAGEKAVSVTGRMLPQVPESFIRKAFENRDVKMNGIRIPRDALVEAGAEIRVYLSDECPVRSPEILYEDDNLLIVNKPAGVSCEPDEKGGITIGEWIFFAFPDRYSTPPFPCHRLDNPTEGLLLMAKQPHALQAMELAFQSRQIHKTYQCLVKGTPKPERGLLRSYLSKDAEASHVTVYDRPVPGALTAETEYRVLEKGEVSRLEIKLHTGRTHQIRAQMAHIGHPILGDDKYGDRTFNREQRARKLMLTATGLSFALEGPFAYMNQKTFAITPKY